MCVPMVDVFPEFLCISSMFLKAGWRDELRPGMVWHREFRENLTQSVIWSVGVDFCHCSDVHWIYVITSNLQRAPGQVAQSSGPVQAPSKFLGASLVGFLRIS